MTHHLIRNRDLTGLNILVAEHEYLQAADLCRFFVDVGATIVGPCTSVQAAMLGMDASTRIDFAVLDIKLGGELIYPVSDRLSRNEIPYVYFTNCDVEILPQAVRESSFVSKLSGKTALVDHIRSAMRKPDRYERALKAIPALRAAARAMMSDDHAADDLVEQTLRRAITEMEDEAKYQSTEHWLHALLDNVYRQRLDRLN